MKSLLNSSLFTLTTSFKYSNSQSSKWVYNVRHRGPSVFNSIGNPCCPPTICCDQFPPGSCEQAVDLAEGPCMERTHHCDPSVQFDVSHIHPRVSLQASLESQFSSFGENYILNSFQNTGFKYDHYLSHFLFDIEMKWNEKGYLFPAHMASKCHRMWQELAPCQSGSIKVNSNNYNTYYDNQ